MADDLQADVAAIARIAAVPTILDVVCRTTGMGFAAVARVTSERWIACAVQDSIAFGLQPGGELEVETTICHTIRDSHTPVIINEVSGDPIYRDHHTPARYAFQSYISMPIILPDGAFFGTLCAIDPAPHKLNTPEIVGMFKLFAELVAFHLDANSRVAKAEAKFLKEHETAILREQFIAVLGHDLRNPLQSLSSGMTQLLRKPDQATAIVTYMRRSVNRMAGLIENVLDFARGRLGDGLTLARDGSEPLDPTLAQVIMELQSAWPDRVVVADIALHKTINCDRGRVAQLFSNLLGNAFTHGASDAPIKIRARANAELFELSVSNTGDPISPAAMERLFQPFFRGETRANQQGLGLGLYIASEIARAHGGAIDVTSTDANTCFTFRMPLTPEP